MSTISIFTSALEAVQAESVTDGQPDRVKEFQALDEFKRLASVRQQELEQRDREDREAFLAANKAGWQTFRVAKDAERAAKVAESDALDAVVKR